MIRLDKEEEEDKVKEIATPVPSVVTCYGYIKELLSKLVDLLVV